MVKYTVAMTNYNMADTLERSIRSIYKLTDEKYEILVVDDGSTDGSVRVLERLESELDRVRFFVDENEYYFRTRRIANESARGDYVLMELDADDKYFCGIQDFVTIFHQIEEQVDFEPFLSGNHIHMASKSLLQKENFRNLGYGGARDLWRRLIIRGVFIGLHHNGIKRSIGYNRSGMNKVSTRFEHLVTEFRSGIRPWSHFRWTFRKIFDWRLRRDISMMAIIFNLIATPFAYFTALRTGIYDDLLPEYADIGHYEKILSAHKMTLSDIEDYYNIEIDRSKLSDKGQEVFDLDASKTKGPKYWLNEPIEINSTPDDIALFK